MTTENEGNAFAKVADFFYGLWLFLSSTTGLFLVKAVLAIYLNVMLVLWGMLAFDVATLRFNFIKWVFQIPDTPEFIVPDLLFLIALALVGGGIGGVIYGMEKLYKYSTAGEFELTYVGDYLFRQFGSAALGAIVFTLIVAGFLNLDFASAGISAPSFLPTSTPVATETAVSTEEPVTTEEPAATEAPVVTDEPVATEEPAFGEDTAPNEGENNAIKDAQNNEEGKALDKSYGFWAFGIGFLSGFGNYQVMKKLDQIIKVIFGELTSDDIDKNHK